MSDDDDDDDDDEDDDVQRECKILVKDVLHKFRTFM
jgi:hypothetical protein